MKLKVRRKKKRIDPSKLSPKQRRKLLSNIDYSDFELRVWAKWRREVWEKKRQKALQIKLELASESN